MDRNETAEVLAELMDLATHGKDEEYAALLEKHPELKQGRENLPEAHRRVQGALLKYGDALRAGFPEIAEDLRRLKPEE